MFVSGFTFIRNAVKYDYPVVESIKSVLPLCDEFVVALGNSDDETETLIKSIDSPKIKIINTVWDESLREGGRVLAAETDKALRAINPDADWAFYMQADEVLHEKYIDAVMDAMRKWKDTPEVEGLLFNYVHFYGSYDFVGDSRRWYRHEIRIVRNHKDIHSFRDAQGFRKNNKLMKVKAVDACIYHYGWVKPPDKQQEKQKYFHKLWHDDDWVKKNISQTPVFDYSKIDALRPFKDTHPAVMHNRIKMKNWFFDFDPTQRKLSLKNKILFFVEKLTGIRIGEYRNYKRIR